MKSVTCAILFVGFVNSFNGNKGQVADLVLAVITLLASVIFMILGV